MIRRRALSAHPIGLSLPNSWEWDYRDGYTPDLYATEGTAGQTFEFRNDGLFMDGPSLPANGYLYLCVAQTVHNKMKAAGLVSMEIKYKNLTVNQGVVRFYIPAANGYRVYTEHAGNGLFYYITSNVKISSSPYTGDHIIKLTDNHSTQKLSIALDGTVLVNNLGDASAKDNYWGTTSLLVVRHGASGISPTIIIQHVKIEWS